MNQPVQRVLPWLLSACTLGFACAVRTPPPPGASGGEIYDAQLCANCHDAPGSDGTSRGPALRDLSAHWNAQDLAGFLDDPQGWEESDPRLGRLVEDFSGDMGSYSNLSQSQRLVLARWLLTL